MQKKANSAVDYELASASFLLRQAWIMTFRNMTEVRLEKLAERRMMFRSMDLGVWQRCVQKHWQEGE